MAQIPEFITFEDRLENSLQRDIVKMEHLRMRLAHENINSDIIDMELIELKFIFDRGRPKYQILGKRHIEAVQFTMITGTPPSCLTTNRGLHLISTSRLSSLTLSKE